MKHRAGCMSESASLNGVDSPAAGTITVDEPRLDAHDRAVWARFAIQARMRAGTREHHRLVDQAKRVAGRCLDAALEPAVMWSAGKDSTVLAHLTTVALGASVRLVSEKDDLDYPGEVEYITRLAQCWGAKLDIVRPEISPSQWIAQHAHELTPDADIHSRAADLSKACFYSVVELATADNDAILLGLRADESKDRLRNRKFNGLTYRRSDGKTVCSPLGDWTGVDVYAYLLTHGIEPLHVYRCVGFLHERAPWHVRKSWWLPGSNSRHGEVAWLRHYYPSLFAKFKEWFPRAQSLG